MIKNPEIEINKPSEQWSNGLMNHWFKYKGFSYRVMQKGWKRGDEEQTTLRLDDERQEDIPKYGDTNRRRWDYHALRYSETFDGLITPLAAAKIVEVCDKSYNEGYKFGYADAQRDIRNALGIK